MPTIFDELEGLLGADAVAKLPQETRNKLEFGEQLTGYYNGDIEEAPKPRTPARAAEPAAEAVKPGTGAFADLASLETLFDRKLGNIDDRIKAGVEAVVKERGAEIFNNATAAATNTMTGILKVGKRHRDTLGEDFDPEALNVWATEQQKAGAKFSSVEDAYDKWVAPRLTDKAIKDGIREGLKTRTSQQEVPGYTPPSANAPSRVLSMRGRADGGAGSAVSAAAADLAARRQAS